MNRQSKNPIRRFLEFTFVGRSLARVITLILVFQMLVWNQMQVLAADRAPKPAGQVATAVAPAGNIVTVGGTVQLDGLASFDADGNPLTYRWALTARPAGSNATLSNPAIVNPTFVADRVGTFVAQFIVDDGKELSAPDTVAILVVPPQLTVPNVVGLAQAAAAASITGAGFIVGNVTTQAHATVPAGSVISQSPAGGSLAYQGSPVNLVVSSGATLVTVPNVLGLAQANAESAIIAAGLTVGTVNLVNNSTFPAGQVFAQSPGAGSQVAGPSPVNITVSAGVGTTTVPNLAGLTEAQAKSVLYQAQLLPGSVALNPNASVPAGQIFAQAPAAGATATPGASVNVTISTGQSIPPDGTAPAVTIHSPVADSAVTYLTDIVATVTDTNLAFYQVQYAPDTAVDASNPALDDPDYVTLSQGTTPVTNAVVGVFDPTMLENDNYVIRVKAIDAGGLVTVRATTVGVAANAKLGQFSLEFTDMSVPLVGIPIQIVRRYDSFKASRSGDFGYGWSLGLRSADIRALLKPNPGGATLAPNSRLYITAPDGRRIGFTARNTPPDIFFNSVTVSFQADPGVYEKLDILDGSTAFFRGGLYVDFFSEAFYPQKYRLTLKDGTQYDYDRTAGLEKITDLNGNTVTFMANAITHSSGQSIPLVRDGQNRITRITDPAGNSITYGYSASGDLISFTDRTGLVTQFTYKPVPRHYLDSVIDPLGRMATRTEYDESGRIVAVIDALGNRQEQNFDPNAFTGTRTDARGNVTTLVYNARGNLLEERDPEGGLKRYEYNDPANPDKESKVIDPNGHQTDKTYDSRGNITSTTDHLGNTTSIAYNILNKPTLFTNPLGQTLTLTYNVAGALLEVVNNLGQRTVATRDAKGRITSLTDAVGNTTIFDYTDGCPCGNPSKVINPDGSFRLYEYDSAGQIIREVNELGAAILANYDNEGRQIWKQDPLGHRTVFNYVGPLQTSVTDPLMRTTHYEYDSLDRKTKITDPAGGIVRFEYDANGNRTKVTDPVNNATTFIYDRANRLVRETNSLGNARTFTYDAAGNRIEATDRNGRRRTFEFDALNRMTKEKWWDGASLTRTIEFAFNALGTQTPASDPVARFDYTYDNFNRLAKVIQSATPGQPDFTLTYTYTALGQVASVTDNYGVSITSSYDNRNRLAMRTWQGPLVDPARVDFTYDTTGNRTRIDRFSDLAGTNRVGFTNSAYNAASLLESTSHFDQASQVVTIFGHEFDAANQIAKWNIGNQASTFAYDAAGQLTGAANTTLPSESFAYDQNGNRTGGGYSVGGDNQILSDGSHSYAYDAEGNMIFRRNTASGDITHYTFDHRNRLLNVEDRNSSGLVTQVITFGYDAMNRRLSKTVNGNVSRFLYNHNDSWADLSGTNAVVARYLYGAKIDEVLARQRAGDGRGWYLTDHLGTVRNIANAAGSVIAHIDYSSFGRVLGNSNPSAADRFLFTGRELDDETGLYFYRARYYSPSIGKFISGDPLGFSADDFNLFRYAKNSLLNASDPFGESVFWDFSITVKNVALKVFAGATLRIAIHGAHHSFFLLGLKLWCVHIQIWAYFPGVRNSGADPLRIALLPFCRLTDPRF